MRKHMRVQVPPSAPMKKWVAEKRDLSSSRLLFARPSKLFTSTGSAGYTGVLQCTSGLCGGSFFMSLKFKGTAE